MPRGRLRGPGGKRAVMVVDENECDQSTESLEVMSEADLSGTTGGNDVRAAQPVVAGPSSRRGRRVNVVQAPRSYGGGEGFGEFQVVADGIQDVMGKVMQSAGSCLAGFVRGDDTPENKAEKENAMEQFKDVAVALTRAQEKLRILPSAAADTFDYLDIGALAEAEGDDRQFFGLLDQFEEAAKVEGAKRCESITDEVVGKNPMYRRFLQEINKFSSDRGEQSNVSPKPNQTPPNPPAQQEDEQNGFSEGLQLLTEYIPTTDPITRKLLKDPVVNRKCNHVYENESIVGMMVASGTRATRCPYPGCCNQTPIKSDDLFRDLGLARKIAEKIKEGVVE